MRLPTPLLRKNPEAYKNMYGHLLILAGSKRMLGASALCGLSAMRSGAGLTTLGVPENLNNTLQKKISPVIMTLPLPETKEVTFAFKAWSTIKKNVAPFNAMVIGPGITQHSDTQKFVRAVIKNSAIPLVIDAEALKALAGHTTILLKTTTPKILTPHLGEFARLINEKSVSDNLTNPAFRKKAALAFANEFKCILVLKSHQTIVAAPGKKIYINNTGNAGMATAGSGDVLAGMIGAFLGQGINPFEAATSAVYLNGLAGDLAADALGKTPMIASDIIDYIPNAFKLKIKN